MKKQVVEQESRPKREQQVLELAAEGKTDKEIAKDLGISAETVATYWRRILLRTGASSRTEVVAREFQRRAQAAIAEERSRHEELETEIASRRQIEQQLRSMVTRLRLLVERAPTGMVFENAERKVLLVNPHILELFMLPVSAMSLIGANCREIAIEYSRLFAEPEQFVNRVEEIVSAARSVHHEQIQLADGRWIERDYEPIFVDAQLVGHFWQYRDITQLKQAKWDLQFRSDLAEVLTGFAPQLIGAPRSQVSEVISKALCEIGRVCDVDRVVIHRLCGSKLKFEITHEWCREGISSRKHASPELPISLWQWWAGELKKGEPIQITSLNDLPSEAEVGREMLKSLGVTSLLDVPIMFQDRLLGFVSFDSVQRQRAWTSSTQRLLRDFALMVGAAFQSIGLDDESSDATVNSRHR